VVAAAQRNRPNASARTVIAADSALSRAAQAVARLRPTAAVSDVCAPQTSEWVPPGDVPPPSGPPEWPPDGPETPPPRPDELPIEDPEEIPDDEPEEAPGGGVD